MYVYHAGNRCCYGYLLAHPDKEWFPDTWLNPFIIQDNTGTIILQFVVVIAVGLGLTKFFNRKTGKGPDKGRELSMRIERR